MLFSFATVRIQRYVIRCLQSMVCYGTVILYGRKVIFPQNDFLTQKYPLGSTVLSRTLLIIAFHQNKYVCICIHTTCKNAHKMSILALHTSFLKTGVTIGGTGLYANYLASDHCHLTKILGQVSSLEKLNLEQQVRLPRVTNLKACTVREMRVKYKMH